MIDPNAKPAAPDATQTGGLALPPQADLAFWRGEVDRADATQRVYHKDWADNIAWYAGKSPDYLKAGDNSDFVNVNVDFYQTEQKLAQLFYETPELQLRGTGPLKGRDDILQAHKDLLAELLDRCDILNHAVLPAIKDCLAVSGTGAVVIGYQPTLRSVQPPIQLGSMLGLNGPVQVPIYQQWYGLWVPPKKFLRPADFHSTLWDLAPWLGIRFRMPETLARREFAAAFAKQPDFKGTSTRDEHVLDDIARGQEPSGLNYVDGVLLFYRATFFDATADHPELYRELVLIDGLDIEARHRDCPHQTILPTGQLTADSLIGNPIHPLTIRSVPDSAYTPSDSLMTRPLVKELCKFRTQMVQERDANRPINLYDIDKLPPETIDKIVNRTIGSLIPVESLAAGPDAILKQVVQPGSGRQTYIANDYVTKDIEKVLAIDASGAGVTDDQDETATKTAVVDRNRNTRLDAERRQVLRWYLRLIDKFSALVCRYMAPQLAAQYIGPQAAALWASWDKKSIDSRIAFAAKPDSQIRLDAAAERRFALQLYQMVANDPNVVRVELLKNLFIKAGYDPQRMVVEQLPEKKPDPSLGFSFKGEDFVGPQSPIVMEILAQAGIRVSQQAADGAAGLMFKQVALGLRDASGKPVPTAAKKPAEHGGPAEQVRPLSKQQGDETGNRPGPTYGEAA